MSPRSAPFDESTIFRYYSAVSGGARARAPTRACVTSVPLPKLLSAGDIIIIRGARGAEGALRPHEHGARVRALSRELSFRRGTAARTGKPVRLLRRTCPLLPAIGRVAFPLSLSLSLSFFRFFLACDTREMAQSRSASIHSLASGYTRALITPVSESGVFNLNINGGLSNITLNNYSRHRREAGS
jgi:hypothetical protein